MVSSEADALYRGGSDFLVSMKPAAQGQRVAVEYSGVHTIVNGLQIDIMLLITSGSPARSDAFASQSSGAPP